MAVMPRGGCLPPRSAFAAVAFAVMAFAAACLVGAVLGAVAVRGLLVKNLLLFGAELAVELFDGLVAGGHAVLAFGLHGLHAVEALGCGQALECIPASALFRLAGGRLHGADKLVPRAFLRADDLQTLLEIGHAFGVAFCMAFGMAVCFARVGALFAGLGRGFARCGHGCLRRGGGCGSGHQGNGQPGFAALEHGAFPFVRRFHEEDEMPPPVFAVRHACQCVGRMFRAARGIEVF